MPRIHSSALDRPDDRVRLNAIASFPRTAAATGWLRDDCFCDLERSDLTIALATSRSCVSAAPDDRFLMNALVSRETGLTIAFA
ncbi:MAG: hypothetical protein ACLP8S_15760 [Solirubrobacteraceae bacterium]